MHPSAKSSHGETSPTGKGIGIAFLDTGISPVADFTVPNNRIVAFHDFIDGKQQPYDNNGHGTQVTYFLLFFYRCCVSFCGVI
ncbi:hypothetical protein [Chakrabartyella piscis]|uniref:hypothetical protein n=1 Tax=Chakrabartyella piscis TaxID=2918914 RepID=UPI002958A662|nr:hypothetical protein [Chakrabartyella piscis]